MKKVAILLRDNLSMTDKKILSVNKDLNTFLDKYNVIPIYFYITDYNYSKIKELLDISDGVILPGGDVFNSNVEKILKYKTNFIGIYKHHLSKNYNLQKRSFVNSLLSLQIVFYLDTYILLLKTSNPFPH